MRFEIAALGGSDGALACLLKVPRLPSDCGRYDRLPQVIEWRGRWFTFLSRARAAPGNAPGHVTYVEGRRWVAPDGPDLELDPEQISLEVEGVTR